MNEKEYLHLTRDCIQPFRLYLRQKCMISILMHTLSFALQADVAPESLVGPMERILLYQHEKKWC